ncbi:MAG TPA: M64 family metallopeptidase [Bdellovibrionales bacterium]|nr:M64 family metallopeptidase [Bdellovibrionales bacterium]
MRSLIFAAMLLVHSTSSAAYRVGKIVTKDSEKIIFATESRLGVTAGEQKVLRSIPFFLSEDNPPSEQRFEEVLVSDVDLALLGGFQPSTESWPGSEVRTLVEQGPSANRIVLTIVGDGYTQQEKEKFFADAQRVSDDLFGTSTFVSYLSLFNVYAVFVPSNESGLTDTEPRDTALGLYRTPAGSKRAIYLDNVTAAERALALAPAQADYPILLANDGFYGGLGGRYAITTSSKTSGTIVLRHELGHNFGDVGEEYDGGQVYTGANFSPRANVSWSQWQTTAQTRVFESKKIMGDYVWKDLKTGPYKLRFDFPYDGYSFGLQVSTVGWETPNDVSTKIDGKEIPLNGVYHIDRSFLEPAETVDLARGSHELLISERIADGNNVLGFAMGWAYPGDYDFTPDLVGAFSTFNDMGRRVGYRPTHDSCLMRNMESKKFCAVDQENMWIRFLERLNLIDSLQSSKADGNQLLVLKTLALNGLEVQWFKKTSKGYVELTEAKNSKILSPVDVGDYRVKVTFRTPEVRLNSPVMSDVADISVR